MFRYEIGAHILVKRFEGDATQEAIEVKILAKAPNQIKAEVLSDGWFSLGSIHWLSGGDWFSIARVRSRESPNDDQ